VGGVLLEFLEHLDAPKSSVTGEDSRCKIIPNFKEVVSIIFWDDS
jgi:hypothetical protein